MDFDFFDPNPNVDYHALKRLLAQLFQRDADIFHLHELTELILSQPTVGTTIKTDGIESDPYAVLTVLNMHVHQVRSWLGHTYLTRDPRTNSPPLQNHPSIKALASYFLEKSSADPAFHSTLQSLFSDPHSGNHVGWVFCERLINMPVQVIPPMYRMLGEEIKWAIDDVRYYRRSSVVFLVSDFPPRYLARKNEPYSFSHLIFVSRTYHLTPEEESSLSSSRTQSPKPKKSKKSKAPSQAAAVQPADGIYSFHPEDEYIKQVRVVLLFVITRIL